MNDQADGLRKAHGKEYAAQQWQDFDPDVVPEELRWYLALNDDEPTYKVLMGTDYPGASWAEIWERNDWGITQWKYIKPPAPKILPCALHPDLEPGDDSLGWVYCNHRADNHGHDCCRMSTVELWNDMQEWLEEKMDV